MGDIRDPLRILEALRALQEKTAAAVGQPDAVFGITVYRRGESWLFRLRHEWTGTDGEQQSVTQDIPFLGVESARDESMMLETARRELGWLYRRSEDARG